MRMPVRLRVSWQDETTLKFETDGPAGTLVPFRRPNVGRPPQWQGQSAACGRRWHRGKASRQREAAAADVAVE